MKGFTIISYPTQKDATLLSLSQSRSRYMLPIGGRFRVVDFTIRNSVSSGAESTILYNSSNDDLDQYLKDYTDISQENDIHNIKIYPLDHSNLNSILEVISESNSSNFVIYNGDNPSIIDFSKLVNKFKSSKKKSVLFKLKLDGKASMAHKIVITDKRTLTSVIKKALKENREAPNFFEMIINILIHDGISTSAIDAFYRPINNVNEYYNLNREIIWNRDIAELLHREKLIKSQIKSDGYALLDERGVIKNSFISDYCYINGTVENSIVFPGVEIHEKALIKNSIILPFIKVGPGARIINSIIDENTVPENKTFNIEMNCRIGSDEKFVKNSDFPRLLNSSLTLIGKENVIKENAVIGAGCYVASGRAADFFMDKNRLPDGKSLL